ncbi:MAG: hypothetical protein DI537_05915 [Stutzerimonas stutzeri]|uniref:DUF6894 family protein n=1 Tax=Bosea eneae TaxID=151454 RepID=A0ABW0IQH3_9HYPH|nr:MAG: hypothetical protein DI537_05915 [Stutzerimonas stutzeri]
MPRYFFHTRDGDHIELDDEGTELPDDRAAKNAAKELLSGLNREKLPNGDHMELAVVVKDSAGVKIYTVTLHLDGH